jgi:hypothetical protein
VAKGAHSGKGRGELTSDEYIENFCKHIELELPQAKRENGGRGMRYKGLLVAARWSNGLWDIQIDNEMQESIQRHYDPARANSPEAAARYFVDALLRLSGDEPIPRPEVVHRPGRRAGSRSPN